MLVVELAIFLFLFWYLARYAATGLRTGRTMQLGSDFFPVWPFIMMVPLALGLMAIEMVWQIALHVRHFATGTPLPAAEADPTAGGQ